MFLVRGRGGGMGVVVWARCSLRGTDVTRHHELVLLDMLVSHLLLGLASWDGISCVETASLMRVPRSARHARHRLLLMQVRSFFLCCRLFAQMLLSGGVVLLRCLHHRLACRRVIPA